MFGLGLPYKILAGALAFILVIGGAYMKGHGDGRAKEAAVSATWKSNARQWKANSGVWKARFTAEADQRAAEFQKAVDAVSDVERACIGRVRAARQSEAALRKLVARPVAVDPQGCPAPVIWRESDLRPVLRPEVR